MLQKCCTVMTADGEKLVRLHFRIYSQEWYHRQCVESQEVMLNFLLSNYFSCIFFFFFASVDTEVLTAHVKG